MVRLLLPLVVALVIACSASPSEPASDLQPPAPLTDAATPTDLRTRPVDLGPLTGEAVQVASEAELLPGAPRLRVALVDVGQGDGMVLWLPGGAVLALDGGPDQNAAYAAFLRSERLTRVDYALLSHPHADHYTGLPAAMALLPSDCKPRVFDPGYDRSSVGGYRYFRGAAGCRYRAARAGEALPLDPLAEVRVLSAYSTPFPDEESTGVNNTSVVLRIRYHKFSIILGGDAEIDAEKALFLREGAALRSTVMKIGHHGSCDATGRSLLQAVRPQWEIMSLSGQNPFGHPHCQTIEKLKGMPGRWLRTDRNGTVNIVTDGISYVVSWERGAHSDAACPRDCALPLDF